MAQHTEDHLTRSTRLRGISKSLGRSSKKTAATVESNESEDGWLTHLVGEAPTQQVIQGIHALLTDDPLEQSDYHVVLPPTYMGPTPEPVQRTDLKLSTVAWEEHICDDAEADFNRPRLNFRSHHIYEVYKTLIKMVVQVILLLASWAYCVRSFHRNKDEYIFPSCDAICSSAVTSAMCHISFLSTFTFPLWCMLVTIWVFARQLVYLQLYDELLPYRIHLNVHKEPLYASGILHVLILYFLLGVGTVYFNGTWDAIPGHNISATWLIAYYSPMGAFLTTFVSEWDVHAEMLTLSEGLQIANADWVRWFWLKMVVVEEFAFAHAYSSYLTERKRRRQARLLGISDWKKHNLGIQVVRVVAKLASAKGQAELKFARSKFIGKPFAQPWWAWRCLQDCAFANDRTEQWRRHFRVFRMVVNLMVGLASFLYVVTFLWHFASQDYIKKEWIPKYLRPSHAMQIVAKDNILSHFTGVADAAEAIGNTIS
eukprot:GEMP01028556.1.p1 GENE.GEMP01028556.1~~GEMP01028556.1.p1  ORF type:complete len:484 (+),score=71.84 GEMP01028556.1:298-1749(+)